jgi:hypothetical protein
MFFLSAQKALRLCMCAYVCNLERRILTPWSWVLLGKLIGCGLAKEFAKFYGTQVFIIMFTTAFPFSLSWARRIRSTLFYPIAWRTTVTLSYLPSFFLFFVAQRPCVGVGLLTVGGLEITLRRTTLGRTPLNEWQHTTLTTDRHPCFRRDSNPQSQQASGHRPKRSRGHRDLLPYLLRVSIPSGFLRSSFASITLYTLLLSPIRVTCPAHLIVPDL